LTSRRRKQQTRRHGRFHLRKANRIIFFGDSLTALAVKDANVPESKGYVPLVRAALKDSGVEVDAVATGGHKVTDLLKRVDQDVLAKRPTVVVIQIGVNDASAGVTPELFKAQLEELIGKLQQGGARVIQCTCTCRIEGYDPDNAMDKKLDALAEVARLIAMEKQLPLVDLRKAFIEYWKTNNPENKPKVSHLRRQSLDGGRPQIRRRTDVEEIQVVIRGEPYLEVSRWSTKINLRNPNSCMPNKSTKKSMEGFTSYMMQTFAG